MDIEKIIAKSGLSRKKFAESVYVSDRTVYNWLAGKRIPKQQQRLIQDIYGKREPPTQKSEVNID